MHTKHPAPTVDVREGHGQRIERTGPAKQTRQNTERMETTIKVRVSYPVEVAFDQLHVHEPVLLRELDARTQLHTKAAEQRVESTKEAVRAKYGEGWLRAHGGKKQRDRTRDRWQHEGSPAERSFRIMNEASHTCSSFARLMPSSRWFSRTAISAQTHPTHPEAKTIQCERGR